MLGSFLITALLPGGPEERVLLAAVDDAELWATVDLGGLVITKLEWTGRLRCTLKTVLDIPVWSKMTGTQPGSYTPPVPFLQADLKFEATKG